MERRGTLKSWNDAKGFGFIQPEGGGEPLFVHISAMRGDSRPQVGDTVVYVAGSDAQGRPRAQHMRHAGLSLDRPAIRRKPAGTAKSSKPATPKSTRPARGERSTQPGIQQLPLKLLVLAALCVLPVWGGLVLLEQGLVWVLLAYPLVSLFSFCQYWLDKQSARKGRWRTPENSLHIAELLGGWPGALVAQQVFRHKTRKLSFQLVFWAIVALHQAFWIDQLTLGGRYLGHLLPL
ncbi:MULTISPECIES: DUF1294 domain-containing protein [unclassified Pseudomonas]|uniref:DUF1294 domain-containing protein n=1 Tax=unclassified Pseudomonas TaxID=196821 RepID=UPI00244AE10C|nr:MULTISPECIES: DUF1294 domain-containing protein [unclassified Pseudomonas]MDG9922999.1 DUF1294 domain-containing protein [Pseudomonas sp. GD04045]MDH0035637.1 DUF1294 domain-containing protein [Pseudomonas sp. GD04019]